MAHTARKGSEKKEYFDPPDVLEGKVKQLAQWIRESEHFIVFTVSNKLTKKIMHATIIYLYLYSLAYAGCWY